jgi:hypothetical protein
VLYQLCSAEIGAKKIAREKAKLIKKMVHNLKI